MIIRAAQISSNISHREDGSLQAESPEPVLGIPAEKASDMVPADLLQGGEIILLLLKPHPLFILLTSLGTLFILAILMTVSGFLQHFYEVQWIPEEGLIPLCVLIAVLRLGWGAMEWASRTYLLTDRRVIRIMGVGRTQIFQAPLSKIRHTEILTTLRERMLGLGTLSFSTLGPVIPEAYWVMISRPAEVQEAVHEAIRRYWHS